MSAVLLHCCKSSLLDGSHGTGAFAHQVCVDHYHVCVDISYSCRLCAKVCACVCACGSVYGCAGTPHFSFLLFLLCLLLLLLPYRVSITPFRKLSIALLCGTHGTTAVAQQVCVVHYLLTMRVLTYECVLCSMGVCVGVCGSVDLFVC